MVFVGDEDEINNTYRKSHRVEGITILDSFSYTFSLAEKRIIEY